MPPSARGIVWVVVGLALHVGSWALGRPLVVRGTGVPWGLVVAALGLALLAWDKWRPRPPR